MGLNRSFADGSLDAIYDVTIAYPDNLPEKEEDITRGKFPKEVHFYIRRYEQTSSTMSMNMNNVINSYFLFPIT